MKYRKKIKYENISKIGLIKRIKEKTISLKLQRKSKFSTKKKPTFRYLLKFLFIIIISLSIFSFIIFFMYKKLFYKNISILGYKPRNDDIYRKENFPPLNVSFYNAKKFLSNCLKGIIVNEQSLKYSENPKVSAIVTFHNCKRTISRAILSIQNQNISDIEIVLVNDFSTDETSSIIEDFAKKDPRIKIINNKKNMGTYFCRSIGTLSAKGKYIFHLDGDDMFLDEDSFYTITNIAEKGNFDIVSFRAVFAHYSPNLLTSGIMENYFSNHTPNIVLYQPELGMYGFRPGKTYGTYIITDSYIWTKCAKTSIYQKMVNKVGEERYTRYMVLEEDRTDIYGLYNTAESMKYLGKYAYLKIQTPASMTWRNHPKTESFICKLYFVDISIVVSRENVESKTLLVYFITYLMEREELKEVISTNDYHKKLFISCLERILNNKYIAKEHKDEIKRRIKTIEFLKDYEQFK